MTAVTTAGLLAGLFGSAFVPSAYAVTPGVSLIASRINVDGFLDSDGNDAENQTAAGDGNGTASFPFYLVSPLSNTGANTATSINDDAIADGTTDGARLEIDLELADLDTATGVQIANPTATVNVTGDLIFWCADEATVTADDDYTLFKTASQTYSDSDVDNGLACQVNASDDDVYGTGTITIKIEDTTIVTYYVDLLGPGKTISSANTRRGSYVAIDGSAVSNYMTMNVKDAAGTTLWSYIEDGDKIEDYFNSDTNSEFEVSVAGDDGSDILNESAGAYVGLYADLAAAACPTTKNPGDKLSDIFVYGDEDGDEVYDTGEVKGDTVTITCTGDGSLMEITGYSAGSTVAQGDYAPITLTVVDGHGNPMGIGGDDFDLTLAVGNAVGANANAAVFTPAELTDNAATYSVHGAKLFEEEGTHTCESGTADDQYVDDATVLAGSVVWDGKAVLCYKASTLSTGNHSVIVELPAPDAAGYGDPYTIKVTFKVTAAGTAGGSSTTNTIVAGPKLKTATITLSAAAGKLVTVTIEKVSTGKTFTYYRKANASGVAKFTIRRAGTWEVFASYGDDVTDTVTLKK